MSYFANMKLIIPEFQGMRKFILLNLFKFFMISLGVLIRIVPRKRVHHHDEINLLTHEVFYASLIYTILTIISSF